MKFKFAKALSALPLLFATAATAEQYQSFTSAQYSDWDTPFGNVDAFDVATTYYFAPRVTLGPLRELSYINATSNLFAGLSYADSDFADSDSSLLGGEYFTGALKFGGSFLNSDAGDVFTASAGYLVSSDLLLELSHQSIEDGDNSFIFTGRYNHQLVGSDYIGFEVSVDDGFDNRSLSSKYFTALAGGRYLAASAAIITTDNDTFWSLGGDYYFNKVTSVGLGLADNGGFSLGASHFFNRNVAAEVAYASSEVSEFDVDVLTLGVTVQL